MHAAIRSRPEDQPSDRADAIGGETDPYREQGIVAIATHRRVFRWPPRPKPGPHRRVVDPARMQRPITGQQRAVCRAHAFLAAAQDHGVEAALWVALRALEEHFELLHRLQRRAHDRGQVRTADRFLAQARNVDARAAIIREALVRGDSPEVVA